jgi:hypothetical protein
MWTAMFDPIENSGSAGPQQLHIVGEECQTDWKHPESHHRQEPKNPTKRQAISQSES